MSTLNNFNALLYSSIAAQNADELIGDNPLASMLLNYGSLLGVSYISDLLARKLLQQPSAIDVAPKANSWQQVADKSFGDRLYNLATQGLGLKSAQEFGLNNPLNTPTYDISPKGLTYLLVLDKSYQIKLDSPLKSLNNETTNNIELKNTPKSSLTSNLTSAAAGAAGGIVGSLGGNALGNAIFDTNSKGGAFASGIMGLIGSSVGSAAAGSLASTGSVSLSSLGSAASLGLGAMGVANIALDAFDPVKKSKGENIAGLGLGAAGLTAALAGVPVVGWAAAAGLLAANLAGHLSGKKSLSFTIDKDLFSQVGSSYGGSLSKALDAYANSNVKYSGFNSGGLKKANSIVLEGKRQLDILSSIFDYNRDRGLLSSSMTAINGNRLALDMLGGYNQGSIRVGKSGLKIDTIERAKNILSKYKKLQTNLLQLGGPIDPFEYYLESLPENQRDSTNFRVKDYWIFNGKPKDFKEARRRGMFTPDKKGFYHARSVSENPETGEIEYMKASTHPTRYMESDWYEKGLIYNENDDGTISTIQLKPGVNGYDDWINFTNDYELVKSEPYWKYVKRLQKEIPSHKDGGTFIEISLETSIELVDPIPEFLNGGSINVIPDGALHARKHNMDVDGITKKGIPVVSEKDGEIELLAEIEKEEIIFRLEVTLKLEELEKKFYSEESTLEEKDECALEAGKLLVNEILYNTLDNTNNLL